MRRREMKSCKGPKWTGMAILMILGCAGCRKAQSVMDIPQLVKTVEVLRSDGESSVTYPGKIKAAENVKLAFRVAGPVRKVYVSEGQRVKKGQLLAEMDPRDYRLQYDASLAEYTQVKEEADRVIELYRRGSVSVNEYDKAVAAKKRVAALYDANRNALEDTRLKAPFDGYVQDKYFSAPEIVAQGTPVLSLINDRYFEVTADIPANDFIRREDFTGFYAVADAFPGVRLPLELIDINQGANYNQLFQVRFRLKQDSLKGLAAGMSVTVTIDFRPGSGDFLVIPVSALFQENGMSYVWLLEPKELTVRKKEVQVAQMNKDGSVLVKSDLQRGQTIISAGVNDLKEGQKVKVLSPVPASNVGGLL